MQHVRVGIITALAAACCVFAGSVSATQFPVSGSVTINGGSSTLLPSGVTFGDSTYNASNGELSAGTFNFPVSTVTFDGGTGSVTYQLTQSNTSKAFVGEANFAFLTTANMSLKAISATYGGFIDLGSDCIFGPIHWNNLRGRNSSLANGLALAQASFTVPQTTGSCNGYVGLINPEVAGNDNSISLVIGTSTFATPTHSDLLFIDGFDP